MFSPVRAHARRSSFCSLLLVSLVLSVSCSHKNSESPATPPVVTFIGGGPATQRELSMDQTVFDPFTQQTGIRADFIPGPESMTERLDLYRRYLGSKSTTPDVYYIDVVWPAVLVDQVVDLNQYLAKDAADQLEAQVRNDTVNGKLTSMPFNTEWRVLYYRTDLLRKYGYSHPPNT